MDLAHPPRSRPPGADRNPAPLVRSAGGSVAEVLVEAIQCLVRADDLTAVQGIVRRATRELSHADDTAFIIRDRRSGHATAQWSAAPQQLARRRALEARLGGWAMRNRRAMAISDVATDDRVPAEMSDPTRVRSLVMVPIRMHEPIGAIGAYWADRRESLDAEIGALQALADSTAMALEKLYFADAVEARVAERTAALVATNRRLDSEVRERTRAQEESRVLAFTDELTGLYNRRGFTELATESRRSAAASAGAEQLVFIDIDGLKAVNDTFGHFEGDRLLRSTASLLRETFAEEDILARIGGDEFTIYRSRPIVDRHHIVDRIEAATQRWNRRGDLAAPLALSIGVASADADEETTLEGLLKRSDAAMYEHKRAKRHASGRVGRIATLHAPDARSA